MSEKLPIQYPNEERGRPVLVKNGETGMIDTLRTAGVKYRISDGSKSQQAEVVGIEQSPDDVSLAYTRVVESARLQPEVQEDLAREMSSLPLRGDTVHGLFDGKIENATVGDHSIDANGQKMVLLTSQETGNSKEVDIRALSPEIQARMEADKPLRNAKFGEKTLDTLGVNEPITPEVSTEVNEETDKYGALLRGETEGSVEAAAVRPVETPEEKGLRELREYHQKVAQNGQIQNAADNFRDGHK